jgi:hypothetical protein
MYPEVSPMSSRVGCRGFFDTIIWAARPFFDGRRAWWNGVRSGDVEAAPGVFSGGRLGGPAYCRYRIHSCSLV